MGYICASFHAAGTDFPLVQDIIKYVYDRGKGPGPAQDVGTVIWLRGVISAFVITEAIRTAMHKFGHQPLTGEQVHWGLEHRNLTEKRIQEAEAEG